MWYLFDDFYIILYFFDLRISKFGKLKLVRKM